MSVIFDLINKEAARQNEHLELIASENIASANVMKACGSVLTNKYAEGYPAKRYYGGCEVVDEIEILAQQYCKQIFNVSYVNVQPHSGSQANQAVYFAFLNPGDTILGMSLDCGGHLTHGHKKNMSGNWFNVATYGVDKQTYLIDYNEVREQALKHRPKMIIAGFSAYSRTIDWQKFREIADEVGAILFADIAHVAGLIATGHYPSPVNYVDVITSTTHKTLRGPRGGIIMTNNEEYYKKINSALFPGVQGGPLMHIIAAKAVAFEEILNSNFKEYSSEVIKNAQALAKQLMKNNIEILTNGTDNHMVLVDLRSLGLFGSDVEKYLNSVNIICNKNSIPFDTLAAMKTSGIRLGSPACTTRGLKEAEFVQIADLIATSINAVKNQNTEKMSEEIKLEVKKITEKFPLTF
jgi:glycine hydroxymethyltransferase